MSNEDLYHIVNEIDYQNKTLNMEKTTQLHEVNDNNDGIQFLVPQPKTRTPKSPDSITKGALKMPLQERVALRNTLNVSIAEEVKEREVQAKEAREIAGKLP